MKKLLSALVLAAIAVLASGCASTRNLPKVQKDAAGNNVLVQEGFLCYGMFENTACMVDNGVQAARKKAAAYCEASSTQPREVTYKQGIHDYYVNQTTLLATPNKRVFVTYYFRCE